MPVDTSAPLRDVLKEFKGKSSDEILDHLGQVPFFMNEFKEGDEENPQIEALRALAYEGEPWEIAENFKIKGNECFKVKKYHDAITYYTQALDQHTEKQDINLACLGNRAQCNLELKNYRRCITDCTRCLDIEPTNNKAWYRSAKAFLGLDKPDEAIVCCLRGLDDGPNEPLTKLKETAEARKARKAELAKISETNRLNAEKIAKSLQMALKGRNLRTKYTITNHDSENPGDLKPKLENPLEPNSTLYLPVLVLYPISMESDILQEVDEDASIHDVVMQVFSPAPPWANPADYNADSVDAFAPTVSGGLVKVGKGAKLGKVFSSPSVTMIDNMARIYLLPRAQAATWLKEWNKDAQSKLVRD